MQIQFFYGCAFRCGTKISQTIQIFKYARPVLDLLSGDVFGVHEALLVTHNGELPAVRLERRLHLRDHLLLQRHLLFNGRSHFSKYFVG